MDDVSPKEAFLFLLDDIFHVETVGEYTQIVSQVAEIFPRLNVKRPSKFIDHLIYPLTKNLARVAEMASESDVSSLSVAFEALILGVSRQMQLRLNSFTLGIIETESCEEAMQAYNLFVLLTHLLQATGRLESLRSRLISPDLIESTGLEFNLLIELSLSDSDVSKCTPSRIGIIYILAYFIKSENTSTVYSPTWLFSVLFQLISLAVKSHSELGIIEEASILLNYSLLGLPYREITEIDGLLTDCSFPEILEILLPMITFSNDGPIRSRCFQALRRIINIFSSDARITAYLHLWNPIYSQEINTVSRICSISYLKDDLSQSTSNDGINTEATRKFVEYFSDIEGKAFECHGKAVWENLMAFTMSSNLLSQALNFSIYTVSADTNKNVSAQLWEQYTLDLLLARINRVSANLEKLQISSEQEELKRGLLSLTFDRLRDTIAHHPSRISNHHC